VNCSCKRSSLLRCGHNNGQKKF